MARALGQRLSEKWGQQVVVENKGGGAHVLGAQQVANAAPDGHTLMFAEAGTFVINPNLYPKDKLPIDIEKDFILDHRPGSHPPFGHGRRRTCRSNSSRS